MIKTYQILFFLLCYSFSQIAEAQCPATGATFDANLDGATQASIISMGGVNPLTCDLDSSMTQSWEGGKLLFSDSPESPSSTGMLFKSVGLSSTGSNKNRVFSYHVNNIGSNKKIVVIIKNTSGSTGTFTIHKEGIAGPSSDFPLVGALAYNRWDTSSAESGVSVSSGSIQGFDSTFNGKNVTSGWLYHGIWDYTFDQQHDIYICIGETEANCPSASLLSKDSHQRGTCDYNAKVYDYSGGTIDTATGVQSFSMAGNTSNDSNASCVDETSSSFSLGGNFGILYKIHVPYQSTDSKKLGVCLNPRGVPTGGNWRGATWICPSTDSSCGTNSFAGGHFLIPTSSTISSNANCAVAGDYTPSGTDTWWMQFMPTGGVPMPVRAVMAGH